MNKLYLGIVALSTVIPLTIPLAYLYPSFSTNFIPQIIFEQLIKFLSIEAITQILAVILALALNISLGFIFVFILDYAAKNIGRDPIIVKNVKQLGGDSLMGYLPYVIFLFIEQNGVQPALGWIIGIFILLGLAISARTLPFSPLLRLCGLRFFEATLADKTIVTLLVKDKNISPKNLEFAAWISEFCVYGLDSRKKDEAP